MRGSVTTEGINKCPRRNYVYLVHLITTTKSLYNTNVALYMLYIYIYSKKFTQNFNLLHDYLTNQISAFFFLIQQ